MSHQCPVCSFSTDDAAEMFAHLGGSEKFYDNVYHQRAVKIIVEALGHKYSGGFPELAGNFDVAGLDVEIKPVKRGELLPGRWRKTKSSEHRILVTCPTCHKKIPAGRIHQHLIVHSARTKVCKVCGKSYGTGNHLRKHMRLAHGASELGRFGPEGGSR